MVYEVKEDVLEQYKRMSKRSDNYGVEQDFLPGSEPTASTRKSLVTTPKKKKKVQGDRSLRIDEWVGGYGPTDQKPKRRSYTIKGDALPKF